jgi:preprotein translocase subunit SecG
MEIEEIVKMIIFIVVLTVVIAGVIFLFKGKGGEMLEAIRRGMRFG